MSAILNSLNTHNFPIFQPILMKLVSKFMVYRALSDKSYLLSGLPSPLMAWESSKMLISLSSCVSHCLPVSSANNSCKLFGARSDLTISSGLRVQTVCHSVGISKRIFLSKS